MPTTTVEITPRSILRHRPINPGVADEEVPLVSRARRAPQPTPPIEVVPAWQVVPTPTTAFWVPHQWPLQKQRKVVLLAFGMLVTLLVIVLGQLVLAWIGNGLDDLRYGYPRTFQMDAVVGHEQTGGISHFLAVNLQGHIEVIEFPGGDVAHAHIFLGPQFFGPGTDRLPVTLQFVDPHHTGHPDMVVLVQGSQIVFQNVQGTFQR